MIDAICHGMITQALRSPNLKCYPPLLFFFFWGAAHRVPPGISPTVALSSETVSRYGARSGECAVADAPRKFGGGAADDMLDVRDRRPPPPTDITLNGGDSRDLDAPPREAKCGGDDASTASPVAYAGAKVSVTLPPPSAPSKCNAPPPPPLDALGVGFMWTTLALRAARTAAAAAPVPTATLPLPLSPPPAAPPPPPPLPRGMADRGRMPVGAAAFAPRESLAAADAGRGVARAALPLRPLGSPPTLLLPVPPVAPLADGASEGAVV